MELIILIIIAIQLTGLSKIYNLLKNWNLPKVNEYEKE